MGVSSKSPLKWYKAKINEKLLFFTFTSDARILPKVHRKVYQGEAEQREI